MDAHNVVKISAEDEAERDHIDDKVKFIKSYLRAVFPLRKLYTEEMFVLTHENPTSM